MELIPVVQEPAPPFAPEGKFHVRLTEGRFQNLRRLASWPLLALFFGLAWVQVDGQPWLLFSFEQRRIILFGNALLWHDLPLLAGMLITGASLLFFMAVAWGRVWCGFACPQSIWTWLFIRIEHVVEGPAHLREKREATPLQGRRLLRRVGKHLLWIALAMATAMTFTGYFVPVRDIVGAILQGDMRITLASWLLVAAGLTYLNAGLVREKICLHACPYSRFQGVMFDQHTKTVSYDGRRGEPRASQRRASGHSGDCVDCNICVQVCPTGIDIRDGLQAACIDCAACIDACDRVMGKLGRDLGLIRFASAQQLAGGSERLLRPRLLAYAGVMTIGLVAVLIGFANTSGLVAEIERDRDTLFTYSGQGEICNDYRLKLEAADPDIQFVDVALHGRSGFQLLGPGRIDLTDNDAQWMRYRVCARQPVVPRTELAFRFSYGPHTLQKQTTFVSALL